MPRIRLKESTEFAVAEHVKTINREFITGSGNKPNPRKTRRNSVDKTKDRIIGRIMAVTLFGLSLTFGLARTGTTTTHTGPTNSVTCGVMGCSGTVGTHGGVKGTGHGGGGGTVRISP
jgi:hypothetical protein